MSDPNLPEGVKQSDCDNYGGGGWPEGFIPYKHKEWGNPKEQLCPGCGRIKIPPKKEADGYVPFYVDRCYTCGQYEKEV